MGLKWELKSGGHCSPRQDFMGQDRNGRSEMYLKVELVGVADGKDGCEQEESGMNPKFFVHIAGRMAVPSKDGEHLEGKSGSLASDVLNLQMPN